MLYLAENRKGDVSKIKKIYVSSGLTNNKIKAAIGLMCAPNHKPCKYRKSLLIQLPKAP